MDNVLTVLCAVVRLQQHLGDTAGRAEIAVNLEWWMGVKQVGESAFGRQLIGEHGERVVTIFETCPEVDLPAHGPAGSAVATEAQRLHGCFPKLWGTPAGDLATRVQAPEMRNVTVFARWVVLVFERPVVVEQRVRAVDLGDPRTAERVHLPGRGRGEGHRECYCSGDACCE